MTVEAVIAAVSTQHNTRFEHSIEEVEALGGYSIVYADPAWKYRNSARGSASRHYHTEEFEKLAEMPVSRIAARDSVLFVWVTWPCLREGLDLIEAWGFEYRTLGFIWVKNEKSGKVFWGSGWWSRANSEACLLGVRGDIRRVSAGVHQLVETWDDQEDLVLRAPIGEHSAKPSEVRERIVRLMGDLPRIELFARDRITGWDACGNDPKLGGSDVGLVMP